MKFSVFWAGIVLLFPALAVADEDRVTSALKAAVPQLEVKSISDSRIDGLYRVVDSNGQVIYTSKDGQFFVTGELYSTQNGVLVNLSEEERQGNRKQQIADINPKDVITFPAKGDEKARITVFTDIDCGYCRKLHTEVPRMNELGIAVSYLAFPRAGIGSPSYDKLVSVWCADDRLEAMTQAKAGKVLPAKTCDNPVADEYALGNILGVNGTPAIVLNDGSLVPGYIPAEQLAKGLGIL